MWKFQVDDTQFEIRRFDQTKDSFTELTELLHRAYKPLADMGLRFMATHQDDEVTKQRLQKGESFVIEHEGKLIACITLYKSKGKNRCSWYNTDGVSYFGQFAVEPVFQQRGIGSRMMDFIEEHAREQKMNEISLDTSEQAHRLIDYYTKRGYRFIQYHRWEEVNYRSMVFSKTLKIK
jgi:GNAT superfamily N-acetyltransferase